MRSAGRVIALALLAPAPAAAFPDGAPWDAARGEGCAACHFDAPVHAGSDALTLAGLPERIEPGRSYALTIRLAEEPMAAAGFLISFWQMNEPAGRTEAVGERVAARGAMARSTAAGAEPEAEGKTCWRLLWHAPDDVAGAVRILLWANAGNGDASPFGDSVHRREYIREAAVGGAAESDPRRPD